MRPTRHYRTDHAVPGRAGRGAGSDHASAVLAAARATPLPPRYAPDRWRSSKRQALASTPTATSSRAPSRHCSGSSSTTAKPWAALGGPGHREPWRRRHRGLGDLQHHSRRAPHAHSRAGLRGGQPRGSRPRRGGGGPADTARRRHHAAGVLGDRVQRHRHRASRPGDAGSRAVPDPANSCGTATSSSTRTTR